MIKKTLMGALAISALLLFGTLFVEVTQANPIEIPPPNSIFIRSDGSVSGTDKIVKEGNVYSLTGPLALSYKFIVVQKDDVVLDGAGYTVTGDLSSGGFMSTGIYIDGLSNITIQNFKLNNFNLAINVGRSRQIIILNNTFEKNNFGVNFNGNLSGLGHLVFRNNFAGNNFDIGETTGFNWDNGSVGNFWGNYSGSDLNGDGIGDTPYQITPRDIDNYPLMAPAALSITRPDPTEAPDPTPSASEPEASDYEPVESPTLPPQNSPTPSPSSVPSPSPSPTLSPTIEPTIEPTQTPIPTDSSTPIGEPVMVAYAPQIVVGTVALIAVAAVGILVYFKRRKP